MKQKQKYDFINKNVPFYKNKNVNIYNTDGKLYNTNGKLNHLHIVYTTEKMKTTTQMENFYNIVIGEAFRYENNNF